MVRTRARLAREDRQLLERLAPRFGGWEATVREALQRLAADQDRKEAFSAFLDEWEAEDCLVSPDEVAVLAKRCGL